MEDSFAVDWGKETFMWMNPPYSRLDETINKAVDEKIRAIMILPDWRSENWWKKIQPFVVKRYYYAKGSLVFELPNQDVAGTPWGVWAYKVDCRNVDDGGKKRGRMMK